MALTGVLSKVSFATKVPSLLKATSDDPNPTPGYMYEEIAKISNESLEHCEELVSFLLDRVKKTSHHTKLKALLVIKAVLEKGNSEFRHSLSRQTDIIREARSFNGPPDALYGDHPYVEIRKAASIVLELVFNVDKGSSSRSMNTTLGPGELSMAPKKMEGFGNTVPTADSTLTSSLKKVASFIPDALRGKMKSDIPAQNYRQYVDSDRPINSTPSNTITSVFQRTPTPDYPRQQWGLSQNENGYGGRSYASSDVSRGQLDWREIGQAEVTGSDTIQERMPEEVKYVAQNSFLQETKIVDEVTSPGGVRVGQSKGEVDQFLKRCSTLNVTKIIQLLREKLDSSNPQVQLRTLMLLESLWYSPIEGTKQVIIKESRLRLIELKESAGIAVKTKADKLLLAINPQVTMPDMQEPSQTQSLLAGSPPSYEPAFEQRKRSTPQMNLLMETTEQQAAPSTSPPGQVALPVTGMFSGLNLSEFGTSSNSTAKGSHQDSSTGLLSSFDGSFTNSVKPANDTSKSTKTDSFEALFLNSDVSTLSVSQGSTKDNPRLDSGSLDLLDLDPFVANTSSQPVRGTAVAKDDSSDVLPLAAPLMPSATTTSPQRSPYQPLTADGHFLIRSSETTLSPKVDTSQVDLLNLSTQNISNQHVQAQASSSLIDLAPATMAGARNHPGIARTPFSPSRVPYGAPMQGRPGYYVNSVTMGRAMSPQYSQNTTPIRMSSPSQSSSGFDFISKRGDAFDFVKDAIEESKKRK